MKKTACLALGGLLLAACQTNPDGTRSVSKTAVGGAVGAVAGGVLGNQIDNDGNRDRGTITGAVVGAAAGAGLGYMMDRQERELRQAVADERVAKEVEVERVRDDLLKLTLANEVSFDYDSAQIKPAFRPTLDKLADVLAKYDRNRVTIVGHTDSTGSETYNQTLSERRAQAVMSEMVRLGVPGSMMSATGRGEVEPRATNATEAGRQLNRRVEVLVQPVA
jgi:outer membrane protein OmpA-like peptidoglycan-associated protein